jgi:hypothetical protein
MPESEYIALAPANKGNPCERGSELGKWKCGITAWPWAVADSMPELYTKAGFRQGLTLTFDEARLW